MDRTRNDREILFNDAQLGPYPDHLLKRVDVPTNFIPGASPAARSRKERAKPLSEPTVRIGRTEPLFQAVSHVQKALDSLSDHPNPVAEQKAPIPDDPRVRSRHLKRFAYFLGADMVGICQVPGYALYTDDPNGNPADRSYRYAIVLVKRQDLGSTLASNGNDWIINACTHSLFPLLTYWSEALACYIRRLGFEACGFNNRNLPAVMPSLLIASGIGESGRLGLAVSPFFGANFKATAVMTNMELLPDKPIDFGLQEYCKNCGICAEQCVSGAISKDNEIVAYNGYKKYKIDYTRCATLQANTQKGGSCGRCTLMCPWNRPDSMPGDFKDWDGDLRFLYDSVNSRANYLREHNFKDEEHTAGTWWFDLVENSEGELIIPGSSGQSEL